jgi:hypothetical protein
LRTAPDVHKAADYFEPKLRMAIVRAMRMLRQQVTVADLARAIMLRESHPISRKTIELALQPAKKIVSDALRQGGRIGAAKVR